MSLDDEIRQKKQGLQAALDAEAKRQTVAEQMDDALRAAGMTCYGPELRMPPQDYQPVISETLPRMTFKAPKIIRNMPDGTTRVREARNNQNISERADDYSFDVIVSIKEPKYREKNIERTEAWIFKNGTVAFVMRDSNYIFHMDWPGVTASQFREKIIEAIAMEQIVTPSKPVTLSEDVAHSNSSSTKSPEGCYIATAVYGSYDCPEVWILRRYRDYILWPTWYGKLAIKTYYTLSPSIVKMFGKQEWFRSIWRKRLNSIIDILHRKGFSDKPYVDKK